MLMQGCNDSEHMGLAAESFILFEMGSTKPQHIVILSSLVNGVSSYLI